MKPAPLGSKGMPLVALCSFATAGFITILTEALPAGLLPQMASGLAVSEAMIGQLVTIYAIGSLLAAIPLTAATQGWRRRPLLLLAVAGFAVANTVTAASASYALIMAARFLAGVSAGLLWALLAGYAARMVPEQQKGRAIAIAMAGTPLALSLGVPAGTFIGTMVGWRWCFGAISALALVLVAWIWRSVPDYPGQPASKRVALGDVFALPGVPSVLLVVLTFVLAHNILYTYIAPFLAMAHLGGQTDVVLLILGITSLLSIWIAGRWVDRHLRAAALASTALFLLATLLLALLPGMAGDASIVVYPAVAIWGLAFGGAATLFQTALANAAGAAADVAQSMLVTGWNLAIAGGSIIGAGVLDGAGPQALPAPLFVLLAVSLVVMWRAKRHGFP